MFNIFAQNIDCGYTLEMARRGGSKEYSQSIFWIKIRKNVYPFIPQFHFIKLGFKGVYITDIFFLMSISFSVSLRTGFITVHYIKSVIYLVRLTMFTIKFQSICLVVLEVDFRIKHLRQCGYCKSGNVRENLIFANIREFVA